MKKAVRLIAFILVLAVGIGVVLLSPIGYILSAIIQVKGMELALRQPGVYQPVATRLALYCQSDQDLFPKHLTSAWLPDELNAIRHGRATIEATSAHIEMGGGFHHFGYHLFLDPSASDETTHVWNLNFYSEGAGEKRLTTVSLPKTQRLAPDEIVSMVTGAYDRQIADTPDNLRLYQDKIQIHLRFDQVEAARQACRDMLERLPDDWWSVLVNALLTDALGQRAEAEKLIVEWVNKSPNFFRYLDLAYFYQLTNQPKQAAGAVKAAIEYDANTRWGHGGNSEYRGYTAAMYLYESGNYAECEQLCEKLLGVTVNGTYARRGLTQLLQSTRNAGAGQLETVSWDDAILPFDAFATVDVDKLLGRVVNRPTDKGN